jgi:formamidopyrimidine-DNA glycosylase
MPELPEAERARATIERGALLRRIVAVDDGDSYVCRPHAPGEIADALVGRELTAAHRQGKAMWVETSDDGPVLGLHLGMAGRIVIDEEPAPNGWDRFVVHFEDGGTLPCATSAGWAGRASSPTSPPWGPDAAEIGRDEFRARVGRGTAPLKARLMDQAVVAGVGNLLADEILWRARLDPRRPAASSAPTSSTARAARCAPRCARRCAAAAPTPATSSPRGGVAPPARAAAPRWPARRSAAGRPSGARGAALTVRSRT